MNKLFLGIMKNTNVFGCSHTHTHIKDMIGGSHEIYDFSMVVVNSKIIKLGFYF